jgi:hypothetical protein
MYDTANHIFGRNPPRTTICPSWMAWVSEPVLFLKVRIDETLVLSSKMTNN